MLGAVLAAGAVAVPALPSFAAVEPSALSAVDHRVLDVWSERAKVKAIANQASAEWEAKREQLDVEEALNERSEVAYEALNDVEDKFEEHIGASVLALAAILMIWIGDEPREGLHRAVISAIRPQLVGTIAEDTDRVLASANAA
jgi:hypothetical protein